LNASPITLVPALPTTGTGSWTYTVSAHRGVRPQIAEPPLVALDLFAHTRQRLFYVEHVFQLPGPRREQVDQSTLESPGIVHARGHVHVLLADVIRLDPG
jgi:hypothetical protein